MYANVRNLMIVYVPRISHDFPADSPVLWIFHWEKKLPDCQQNHVIPIVNAGLSQSYTLFEYVWSLLLSCYHSYIYIHIPMLFPTYQWGIKMEHILPLILTDDSPVSLLPVRVFCRPSSFPQRTPLLGVTSLEKFNPSHGGTSLHHPKLVHLGIETLGMTWGFPIFLETPMWIRVI